MLVARVLFFFFHKKAMLREKKSMGLQAANPTNAEDERMVV
jgi:hypothetical protein